MAGKYMSVKKFLAVEDTADMRTESISLYKPELSLGSLEISSGQESVEVSGSRMVDEP